MATPWSHIAGKRHEFIVGVDTHSRTHTYALMAARTGAIEDTQTFPAAEAGINRAAAWIHRSGGPERSVIVAIEGTGSYGAALTRALTSSGLHVVEARPPRRGSRGTKGKSDAIDAIAAARATHALDTAQLVRPRAEGNPRSTHGTPGRKATPGHCTNHQPQRAQRTGPDDRFGP